VDVAMANQQYFMQMAGVGFDAQVVKETAWESKRRYGPLSYIMSAASVAGRKPPTLRVEADGRLTEGAAVLIGNGRYYGARLTVFPEARTDDGLLDVLVFKHVSYIDIARYLGGILVGSHTEFPDVSYFQAREVRVQSEVPVPVEVDGELSGESPVEFRVVGRMRLCVPREYAEAGGEIF
jgi:diacylglycerol kinase family enzyme